MVQTDLEVQNLLDSFLKYQRFPTFNGVGVFYVPHLLTNFMCTGVDNSNKCCFGSTKNYMQCFQYFFL